MYGIKMSDTIPTLYDFRSIGNSGFLLYDKERNNSTVHFD